MGNFEAVLSNKDVGEAPAKLNSDTVNPGVSNDSTEGYEVGSVWVNTATDVVFQCADAGVGAAVWAAANGFFLGKYKTADQDKTNDTTLANDSVLFETVAAGTDYSFYTVLWCFAGSATPDINIRMSGPTGTVIYNISEIISTTGDTTEEDFTAANNFALNNTTVMTFRMIGTFRCVSGGTLAVQWAQNASSADFSRVKMGSFLELHEI